MYFPRVLETTIKQYLELFPVVAITDPRQSGKSTMIKELLGTTFEYVTFDDFRMIGYFNDDPVHFMRQYSDQVIFDKVQKVPETFSHIKVAVDGDQERKGKFIITGSSQFSYIQNITETLAGRIGLLSLLPFQFNEIPSSLRTDAVYRGSYPEVVCTYYPHSREWYSAYLETFVLRDVKSLINIGDLHDFRTFLTLAASRCAQILNYSDIARSIGISVSTIRRWISVLEAAYIVFL